MNETAAPHSESLGKRRYPSLLRPLGLKNDCYLWTSCWVSAPWVHPMRFSIWPSLWPWVTSMLQARKVRGRKHHWLAWNVQYGLICLILFKNVCRINKEKRSHALLALRNLCRVTCAVLELGWSRGPGPVFSEELLDMRWLAAQWLVHGIVTGLLLLWEQLSLSPEDTQCLLWSQNCDKKAESPRNSEGEGGPQSCDSVVL